MTYHMNRYTIWNGNFLGFLHVINKYYGELGNLGNIVCGIYLKTLI